MKMARGDGRVFRREGRMRRGDGSIFQRGRRWFAQWYGPDPSGKAKRFRGTAGDNEKEARAFLREKLREVGNHRAGQSRYRSEEHTSELQSLRHLVCRLL